MTWPVSLAAGRIDLFVRNRIDEKDARRQEATAHALLGRLARQPGVILADEVGMGKTFVALTVALATAWADEKQRPVVIMIPASLKEKWPRDYEVFRERCVTKQSDRDVKFAQATNGLAFFRLLDLDAKKRPRIIFLTHGALGRNLDDPWVKLAILKRAMHGKHLGAKRDNLPRFVNQILRVKSRFRDEEMFARMLRSETDRWGEILAEFNEPLDHAPVPRSIAKVLDRGQLDLDDLARELEDLPIRATESVGDRIDLIRRSLTTAFRRIWQDALKIIDFHSPLVILDEAHHLKNPSTDLASLFEAQQDAEGDTKMLVGALAEGFERMVFLTATPFQLGHVELMNVLGRFRAVNWRTLPKSSTVEAFDEQLRELHEALDRAQRAALDFDNCWRQIRPDDIAAGGPSSGDDWWQRVCADPAVYSQRVQDNYRAYLRAKEALKDTEAKLRPWVVRHLRDRTLPNGTIPRRVRFPGNGIRSGQVDDNTGLSITDSSLLPFLLAARAQSIVAHVARSHSDRSAYRATFAEGLASSYEAFLETRAPTEDDIVDESAEISVADDPRINSYIARLTKELPTEDRFAEHPKVAAVVERCAQLWEAGEKVVVFTHYRVTGRVLVRHISMAILQRLAGKVRAKLEGTSHDPGRLISSWDNAFDRGERLEVALTTSVGRMLDGSGLDESERDKLVNVVRRFVRTQLFLVRYIDLAATDRVGALEQALALPDGSGTSLADRLRTFVTFIAGRCTPLERKEYLDALLTIQPGGAADLVHEREERHNGKEALPNVRLASGGIKAEARRRLLLGFNTPFFPEVLVASSVMAEGVDLHLNCRHMIHHDLAWNPSTIEQRIGRVDRIGAKAERVGKSIEVALPYVAGTQDEKMYRVVMDRERWFQVVMGEKFATDELSIQKQVERVPLPEVVTKELTMRLETWRA